MTLHIDSDGDGEPEATLPLRWVSFLLVALLGLAGFPEFSEWLNVV